MTTRLPAPTLTWFATADVEVGEVITIGATPDGGRRVVPIRGGVVTGDGWSGRVLDAGADFQLSPTPDVALLMAMYVIEAEDGARLFVENRAVRSGDPDDLVKLVSGEAVDPSRIYFRFSPRISAPADGPFAWVNLRLFIGTGTRLPGLVHLEFYAVE